jgi:hypothetical protein
MLPLRISATVESQGRKLPMTLLVDKSGRSRMELDFGESGALRTWIDGDRVWRQMPGATGAPVELKGLERTQEIEGSFAIAMGDWRSAYAAVLVLGREKFEGRDVLRVRTQPREGLASTKLVSVETGAVVVEQGIAFVPGTGLQPTETRHADFREVEGVTLSYVQTVSVGAGGGGTRMAIAVSGIEPRTKIGDDVFAPIDRTPVP